MRVRDYAPSDLDACLAVFDTNVPDFFLPAERADFGRFLSHLPGPYLVLTDEAGRVVACGGYAIEPGAVTADLCWGMVARDRQRARLGRRLTMERLERIREDTATRAVALRTGPRTTAFYEGLGFVTEQVVTNGIAAGIDLFVMRLRLPGGALRDP